MRLDYTPHVEVNAIIEKVCDKIQYLTKHPRLAVSAA